MLEEFPWFNSVSLERHEKSSYLFMPNNIAEVNQNEEGETKMRLQCLDALKLQSTNKGGLDVSDQLTGLYDNDRKPMKWLKKGCLQDYSC